MKKVTYSCDLCKCNKEDSILKGFIMGSNGVIITNNVKDTKKHICHHCIVIISDWMKDNIISAEYNKEERIA